MVASRLLCSPRGVCVTDDVFVDVAPVVTLKAPGPATGSRCLGMIGVVHTYGFLGVPIRPGNEWSRSRQMQGPQKDYPRPPQRVPAFVPKRSPPANAPVKKKSCIGRVVPNTRIILAGSLPTGRYSWYKGLDLLWCLRIN